MHIKPLPMILIEHINDIPDVGRTGIRQILLESQVLHTIELHQHL